MQKNKILLSIFSLLYPIIIFFGLFVFKFPLRFLCLFLLLIVIGYISVISTTERKKNIFATAILPSSLFLVIIIVSFLTKSSVFLQLYPVFVNIGLLCVFTASLFSEEPIIFRFATLAQPFIRKSISRNLVKRYCKKVTVIWCFFFIINGGIAFFTAFYAPEIVWTLYNGLVSYILMGVLFIGEYIVRKFVQKKMPQEIPISKATVKSRSMDMIVCYEDRWDSQKYKTWFDLLKDTSKLREYFKNNKNNKYILHCDDAYFFLITYIALLQSEKEVLLTANASNEFIKEIKDEDTLFLTDKSIANTIQIQDILSNTNLIADELDFPSIDPDETSIIMYTSGSTGHPKSVHQRLTEFEQDNSFILSQWGSDLIERKLCTTVSHHHIYGLLFSVMIPFAAGIPFRRKRIEQPEELLQFNDTNYTIITVPAFLKRANELEINYKMNNPWIFTSGGVLTPEEGKRTYENFGFWPIEVYGSTETSGIAWRCSQNGIQWTPFDNAEITLHENGCIKVKSPYIKDPLGFITGDLADILPDGKFILKGRLDSIVKIEEKRISTTEVENRLIQSGYVKDCSVIPLQNERRQYLGAVVVLNNKGKEKFNNSKKLDINNFFKQYLQDFFEPVTIPRKWRFPDAIPLNNQGKKNREYLESLFETDKKNILIQSIEKNEQEATIIAQIPESSEYFDGHFPDFHLLPAVGQVDIVLKLAKECFNTKMTIEKIKRIKFTDMIRPNAILKISLKLSNDKKNLSMQINSLENDIVYSQGTFFLGDE